MNPIVYILYALHFYCAKENRTFKDVANNRFLIDTVVNNSKWNMLSKYHGVWREGERMWQSLDVSSVRDFLKKYMIG